MKRNISGAKGPNLAALGRLIGIIALAAIITLGLAGCGGEDATTPGGDDNTQQQGGPDKQISFTIKAEGATVSGYNVIVYTSNSPQWYPGPSENDWTDLVLTDGQTSATLGPFTVPSVNGGYSFIIFAKIKPNGWSDDIGAISNIGGTPNPKSAYAFRTVLKTATTWYLEE